MSTLITRFILALLVLGGFVAAGWYFTRPDPVVVSIYTVERGRVEKTVANTRVGTIKACRRSYLAPTIAGDVARLTVKEGDKVETDQVLLEIWNADVKAELELAKAKKIVAQALARETCSKAAGAEREYKRLKGLENDKLISEEKVDFAFTDAKAKRYACHAVNASVHTSDAQIEVIRSTLKRTIIRAPYDGVVAEVNAELGEYVTPSPQGIQTLPAIDLLDLSCLYVSAPIDEVDAPPIMLGMKACVQLDAFPERRCNGIVRRIAPYVLDIEKQARTVEVEVELSDPDDLRGLLPGYSADIEISLDVREDVLRIPTEAVLEGYHVLLYDHETGILAEHQFEPGLSNWNFTEVSSGLEAGDKIVLSVGREGVVAGVKAKPEVSKVAEDQP